MLPARIAIVDLETTGIAATGDRITGIGIVLVEGGEVIEEWQSLVNPERTIPAEMIPFADFEPGNTAGMYGPFPAKARESVAAKSRDRFRALLEGARRTADRRSLFRAATASLPRCLRR